MHSRAVPKPSPRRLLASWLSFPGLAVAGCIERIQRLEDWAADWIKDAIVDFGCAPAEQEGPPQPLPERDLLAESLRDEIDRTLARTVEIANEEPAGSRLPFTEQQVLALFAQLGQTALDRARDLRGGMAEEAVAKPPAGDGWAQRYRRMRADEGRPPPAPWDRR